MKKLRNKIMVMASCILLASSAVSTFAAYYQGSYAGYAYDRSLYSNNSGGGWYDGEAATNYHGNYRAYAYIEAVNSYGGSFAATQNYGTGGWAKTSSRAQSLAKWHSSHKLINNGNVLTDSIIYHWIYK